MVNLLHILWPNLEPSNASAQILYLNQMSDNKKAYYIHQFMGKHPHKIKPIVKIYAAPANALKDYKLVYGYVFV